MLTWLLLGIFACQSLAILVVIANAMLGPDLRRPPRSPLRPPVSVLIPARNEAANIHRCVSSLLAQDYADFEVIVLDDESTDQTAAIVTKLASGEARLRLIHGKPLPPGWIGKSWACHQLSEQAKGDILIFTDADTKHAPGCVSATVAWMAHHRLDFLSTFPQQITRTLGEKLVVPAVDMIVYTFLLLWFTYLSRSPVFAAANGQWIALTRRAYERSGGHAAVRDQIVEDVELCRVVRQHGLRAITVSGRGMIFCRMYDSWRSVWEGFSKNAYGLVRFRTSALVTLSLLMLATGVAPFFLLFSAQTQMPALLVIGMIPLYRGILALAYKHPFWTSVLLHPLSSLLIVAIGWNSWRWFKTGKVRWKGRRIAA